MKRFGTISYNIYCNFTNYGSALQTWALHQAIKKLGYQPVLVDYCPDVLADKDPLNPFRNMWDQDEESRRMCELTMPAIRVNYEKFDRFYRERFNRTGQKYTSSNFDDVVKNEALDGFVCGSDTIFCPDEFGFDDGYYANYSCMRQGYSVAYAASFGDPHFTEESYQILNERLQNFEALGIRESGMVPYLREHTSVPVQRVLDPTLLLTEDDYAPIIAEQQEEEPYLLLYARRYSPKMEAYAEKLAKENGWKIVEISLRATNAEKGHRMAYEAGVEEFLSFVKHAAFVVTNSYHGMIFCLHFKRDFVVFSREQCDTKITELLDLIGLRNRMLVAGNEQTEPIDYSHVYSVLHQERAESAAFLKALLEHQAT